MKRLLLDQGLSRSTARLLDGAGWDVVHVSDIGLSRATDSAIVAHARLDARICVTLDADFHTLLATSGERSPSVIRIRQQGLDAFALANLLQHIWPRVAVALQSGALVMVTEHTIRIRPLPILRP